MTNEDLSKLTVPALRKLATERNIKGRSTMARPALIEALTALQAQDERAAIVDSFIATSVDPSAMDRIDALPDVSGTQLFVHGTNLADGCPACLTPSVVKVGDYAVPPGDIVVLSSTDLVLLIPAAAQATPGTYLLRVSVNAGLSEATLDHFVHALAAALKEAGLCSAVST